MHTIKESSNNSQVKDIPVADNKTLPTIWSGFDDNGMQSKSQIISPIFTLTENYVD